MEFVRNEAARIAVVGGLTKDLQIRIQESAILFNSTAHKSEIH